MSQMTETRSTHLRSALLQLATTLEHVHPQNTVTVNIDGLTCAQLAYCIREAETNERINMIEREDLDRIEAIERSADALLARAVETQKAGLRLAYLGMMALGFSLAALIAVAVLA
jgi:hypothetical protein